MKENIALVGGDASGMNVWVVCGTVEFGDGRTFDTFQSAHSTLDAAWEALHAPRGGARAHKRIALGRRTECDRCDGSIQAALVDPEE